MVVCLLVVSTITTLLAIGPAVVLGTSSPTSSADFSIAVSPSIVPINPGFWGLLSAVSVGSNGFTGDVSLLATAPAGSRDQFRSPHQLWAWWRAVVTTHVCPLSTFP